MSEPPTSPGGTRKGKRSRYLGGYLSEEAAQGLKGYKYAGSDHSLVLKYITNPIYNKIVTYIPLWVAPNLITLSGLGCSWISYWVFFYYCPQLHGVAPWWAYVLNAWSLLSYQALDAIDGKQARRTGSATPLGVLFDHGCDAINATVMSVTLAAMSQMGPGWMSFVFWTTAAVTFYWATVEEYYTGALRLAMINGPNEGLQIAAGLSLLTAAIGPAFWLQPNALLRPWVQINNNELFLLASVACGMVTVLQNAANVYEAVRANKAKVHGGAGKFKYRVAFSRMIPFYLVVLFSFLWVLWSPTDIMSRHPRIVLWALGSLFSKLVTQLMLSHVCDEEYHPVGKTLSLVSFLGIHTLYNLAHQVELPLMETITGSKILQVFNMPVMADRGMNIILPTVSEAPGSVLVPHEELVLYEFFVIATISYLHFVWGVISEITQILKINCLTIPYPPKGA